MILIKLQIRSKKFLNLSGFFFQSLLQSSCLKKKYFVCFQVETITARLDAVAELVNRPEVLSSVQATLGRMCNLDTLLSLCAILPKTDTLPLVEKRINQVIGLKHALEVFSVFLIHIQIYLATRLRITKALSM